MTGWRRRGRRADWVLLVTLLMCQPVKAAPPPVETGPDLELLEFLGTWRDEDGTWMEPSQFEEEGSLSDPASGPSETAGTGQQGGRESSTDSKRGNDRSHVPPQKQTDDAHAR